MLKRLIFLSSACHMMSTIASAVPRCGEAGAMQSRRLRSSAHDCEGRGLTENRGRGCDRARGRSHLWRGWLVAFWPTWRRLARPAGLSLAAVDQRDTIQQLSVPSQSASLNRTEPPAGRRRSVSCVWRRDAGKQCV